MTWRPAHLLRLLRTFRTPAYISPRRGMRRTMLQDILARHQASPLQVKCHCLDCLYSRALLRELDQAEAA